MSISIGVPIVSTMSPEAIECLVNRKFQCRQPVWAKEDISAVKPGVGMCVYARKGDPLIVMSFDPSASNPYGVRLALTNPDGSAVESYRNVLVKDDVLSPVPVAVDA